MARKNIGKRASGNKTPTGTEPPKSPDTEVTEGTTSLPDTAPGAMPETPAEPEPRPGPDFDATRTEPEQGGDAPTAPIETPTSDSTDPAADAPLSEPLSETQPAADPPLSPDRPEGEPADSLDDAASAEDQSAPATAAAAATGSGDAPPDPKAADPQISDPSESPQPQADLRFPSDIPDTEPADSLDDAARSGEREKSEIAAEHDSTAQPQAPRSDTDAAQPADMTKPAGDEDAAPAQPSQDKGGAAPSAQEPATNLHENTGVPAAAAAPASTPPPPPAPKRSIFPLLLGGVLAGGIGFGAQTLLDQRAPAGPDIAALEAEIADLRAALATQDAPADLSPLEAELADLRDQIANLPAPDAGVARDDLDAAVEQLRTELAQADGVDLAPLEARVQDLADALAGQQTTLDDTDARMAALQADLDDLRDLAERRVVEAEAAIDAARAQSGLDSLRAALETGAPYRDAIARLTDAGVAVPDALAQPSDSGIATLEALQEGFDDAARSALRVALQDAPAASATDRLGNFLRAQVGARSTVPRAGDDPDAVLSRAAAEMEAGNLEGALTEIEALPDAAQAAMGDWLSAARARIAAQAALPDLTTAITTE